MGWSWLDVFFPMIHFTIHVPSQVSREFSFSDLFCWGMLGTSNYAKKPLCCVKWAFPKIVVPPNHPDIKIK